MRIKIGFLSGILILLLTSPVIAQTGYIPSYMTTYTCDSMMVSGNYGWHDPSIVPTGYSSEFSFLTYARTDEKPYTMFLWELRTPYTNSFWEHGDYGFKIYNRDDTSEFYSTTGRHTAYIAAPPYGTIPTVEFWEGSFPVYLASTIPQNDLASMNFYACYVTANSATSTPTPEPTATPTNTATPTPTQQTTPINQCAFSDATKIDGYNYTFTVPTGTTSAHYHFTAWGNVAVKVTSPSESNTYNFFSPLRREIVLDIVSPESGTWYIEYVGSPAVYDNGATIDICQTVNATPTPTPAPNTPTAEPTGTPTNTATPEPTTNPPPTLPDATPTPGTWPTPSISTPEPAPTMAGCPVDNPFCGNYFAPVDGTLAEFQMSYNATYCVTFIPAISIVNYEGLTLCLDTYDITASLMDRNIPIILIFTLMTLILVYAVIRG